MMQKIAQLKTQVQDKLGDLIEKIDEQNDELTVQISKSNLLTVAENLRDLPEFSFEILIDVAGVDYLHYGIDEWTTDSATQTGFSRAVSSGHVTDVLCQREQQFPERFSVVYHLLSIKHNQRIRLKVFLGGEPPVIDSVIDIWASANWFEREAFDLFGIYFKSHPDLRRILTDYGFVGHPFRKDFPLIGEVEMRYDAKQERVVYEAVSIEARTLVPKVIREDNRYFIEDKHKNEDAS